jgi:hypothetical protein
MHPAFDNLCRFRQSFVADVADVADVVDVLLPITSQHSN